MSASALRRLTPGIRYNISELALLSRKKPSKPALKSSKPPSAGTIIRPPSTTAVLALTPSRIDHGITYKVTPTGITSSISIPGKPGTSESTVRLSSIPRDESWVTKDTGPDAGDISRVTILGDWTLDLKPGEAPVDYDAMFVALEGLRKICADHPWIEFSYRMPVQLPSTEDLGLPLPLVFVDLDLVDLNGSFKNFRRQIVDGDVGGLGSATKVDSVALDTAVERLFEGLRKAAQAGNA